MTDTTKSVGLGRELEKEKKPSASELPRIRCRLCGWSPRKEDKWFCTCGNEWNTFDTAQRAFISGVRPSASLAADGQRIRSGTRIPEFSYRETSELSYRPRQKLSCWSFSLDHSGFLLAASVFAVSLPWGKALNPRH